ncbi:galanin peptides-like isoform X1 [Sceloporus undulatus]|uniref:galanin peptides-like isoform X1 n=1 Tax=Sceloporus undulatus TaxID=8520 RepID=UPI001C4AB0CF|nr:galanin peptides-like isoform X1 [Sceloporus undulatus]
MWSSRAMFCLSLILCGLLGECFGIALAPKDKRGWTLNSAGYLLGPHAHQTLPDKGGLAGKRDTMEDLYSLGQDPYGHAMHPGEDSNLQSMMDFLSYLNLRDQRAVSRLAFPEESMQK